MPSMVSTIGGTKFGTPQRLTDTVGRLAGRLARGKGTQTKCVDSVAASFALRSVLSLCGWRKEVGGMFLSDRCSVDGRMRDGACFSQIGAVWIVEWGGETISRSKQFCAFSTYVPVNFITSNPVSCLVPAT